MMIVGDAVATIVTDVETLCVLPAVSVIVAVTLNEPAAVYTCETVVLPEMAPRSWADPSPQSRCTLRIASPAGSVPTAIVNVAGRATPGGAVAGVIVIASVVGFTVTPVDTLTVFPELSCTVPVMV